MKQIYLDNAATTFPKPDEVYEAVIHAMKNVGANAGRGGYKTSRLATEILDEARFKMANLINLNDSNKVIFQPSATVATNVILNGLDWNEIKNVYVSPFEHNAIMRTLNKISKNNNINIIEIPFDNVTFELDESKVKKEMIRNKPDLVLMSHISNTTGYILPIEKISLLAKENKAIIVLDCSQSLGLIDLNVNKLNIDFIIFAGHKGLYAPFGIGGFIYLNENIKLKHYITGGTGSESTNLDMPNKMPYKYECGSYNIEAINGLLSGVNFILEHKVENISKKIKYLSDKLIEKLKENIDIELYIPKDEKKHIGIVSLNIEGYKADEIASILDTEFNIAVRSGHHCAPRVGEFLGDKASKNGILRISIGYFNSEEEIEKLILAIEGIY